MNVEARHTDDPNVIKVIINDLHEFDAERSKGWVYDLSKHVINQQRLIDKLRDDIRDLKKKCCRQDEDLVGGMGAHR